MSTRMHAFINPEVVRWARERARASLGKVAGTLDTQQLALWEKGESFPTMRQAQQLARTLSIPFGYLFLSAPPKERIPVPDLRTVGGTGLNRPSPEFIGLLN